LDSQGKVCRPESQPGRSARLKIAPSKSGLRLGWHGFGQKAGAAEFWYTTLPYLGMRSWSLLAV
jgi:hypothetical protein